MFTGCVRLSAEISHRASWDNIASSVETIRRDSLCDSLFADRYDESN